MRLAVLNSDGAQVKTDDKVSKYFLVKTDYDFVANNATNVTSLENLLLFWRNYNKIDYKNFRLMYGIHVSERGFGGLSLFEKQMAAQHFVVDLAARSTVYTIAQQIEFGRIYHELSTACRNERMKKCQLTIYGRLNKSDWQVLLSDVSPLLFSYINYGCEGTDSGDPIGVYDFLSAKPGTIFENTGMPKKNMYPLDGTTIQQLSEDCLNALKGKII